jgi:septal ring factor EnvC (AmiA/AmiB activator)
MDKPDTPPSSSAGTTEGSVVSALPTGPGAPLEATEGRTERIAVMRHELAELQRQLIEAQQRVAAELQGRAEDADRIETLEERVQAHETKAQEDAARIAALGDEGTELRSRLETANKTLDELRVALEARDGRVEELYRKTRELTQELELSGVSLGEAKTQLAARDAELATRVAHLQTEQKTRTHLEGELEALTAKHREISEQLETHTASLRETKALLAAREAELTTKAAEHEDTKQRLEGELQDTRRALDAGRARAQELAKQITTLGEGMLEVVVTNEPRAAQSARSARPSTRPPLVEPHASEPRPMAAVETTHVVAAPRSRLWPAVVGVIIGGAVSLSVVKLTGPTDGSEPHAGAGASQQDVATPPPSFANPVADQPSQPPADASVQVENVADASLPSAEPRPGVIVLPKEAEGRRVYVDGRRLEPKNGRLEVPCGPHDLKIGSQGETRRIDVACVGETEVR